MTLRSQEVPTVPAHALASTRTGQRGADCPVDFNAIVSGFAADQLFAARMASSACDSALDPDEDNSGLEPEEEDLEPEDESDEDPTADYDLETKYAESEER